jgi:UDP-3-O-[3-hydroxymyristoyl] glucosamine N-acyltransferase
MAGQAGIGGHLNIGDGAVIGPKSGIAQDVPAGQTVMGMPPMEGRQYLRYIATAPKLMDMIKKVKQLEKDVAELRQNAPCKD